jgi:hypothetical protein
VGDPVLFQHLFSHNTVKMRANFKKVALFPKKHIYSKFYKINSKLYGKYKQPSPQFLTWLIGFSEGDGSFTMATRGDLHFVIT